MIRKLKIRRLIQESEFYSYLANDEIVILESGCKYNADESKYFITTQRTDLKIENSTETPRSFRPYNISKMGKNNIVFKDLYLEKILLYSLSKKISIQDLDSQIEK